MSDDDNEEEFSHTFRRYVKSLERTVSVFVVCPFCGADTGYFRVERTGESGQEVSLRLPVGGMSCHKCDASLVWKAKPDQ
jgi:hypothetical protein